MPKVEFEISGGFYEKLKTAAKRTKKNDIKPC